MILKTLAAPLVVSIETAWNPTETTRQAGSRVRTANNRVRYEYNVKRLRDVVQPDQPVNLLNRTSDAVLTRAQLNCDYRCNFRWRLHAVLQTAADERPAAAVS